MGIGTDNPAHQLDGASDLVIGNIGEADSGMTFVSATNGQSLIHFSDAISGNARYDGFIGYEQTDRFLKFGTAQEERLRITSGGQVSISGAGTTFGNNTLLNIAPANRTTAFDASDGDTWHDVVIKQGASATTNSVGIAFEVSPSAYHKNAGTCLLYTSPSPRD